MKILKTVILLCLIISLSQNANTQSLQWVTNLEASSSSQSYGVATDSKGNVYSCGQINGTVDFDPDTGVVAIMASNDGYLRKLDADGHFVWGIRIDDNLNNGYATAVETDSEDNVYLTGYFIDSVDFDPDTTSEYILYSPKTSFFILKLTEDGDLVWAKAIYNTQSPSVPRAVALAADDEQNLFIGGNYSDTIDFDPGPGVAQSFEPNLIEGFVLKLDSAGNYVWSKTFPSSNRSEVLGLDTDGNGNVYIAGEYKDSVDLDPGTGTIKYSGVGYSGFLVSLDKNGGLRWQGVLSATNNEYCKDIVFDGVGGVCVTGEFSVPLDFDILAGSHVDTNSGSYDGYLLKLDTLGQFQWVRKFGKPANNAACRGEKLTASGKGRIGVAGYITGEIDFDLHGGSGQVYNSKGGRDYFAAIYDSSGNHLASYAVGSTYPEQTGGIAFDKSDENVFFGTGGFYSGVDFNPDDSLTDSLVAPLFSISAFIQKFQVFILAYDTLVSCGDSLEYNGMTYFTSGSYSKTLLSGNSSADTIVLLDLTLKPNPNTSVDVNGTTLTAQELNSDYQWYDCSLNEPLTSQIDRELLVSENGNYAVILDKEGCVDTSECVEIAGLGINNWTEIYAVKIYPNPSNGSFQLTMNHPMDNVDVQMVNSVGQVVYHEYYKQMTQQQFQLKMVPGMYLLKITNNAGVKLAESFIIK